MPTWDWRGGGPRQRAGASKQIKRIPGDLRAAERSFQQIQQVAGRAGRGDKPGRVFVQTHDPEAPVISALVSGNIAGFYAAETEARREAAMPPFGRLAAIVVSAEDSSETQAVARRI